MLTVTMIACNVKTCFRSSSCEQTVEFTYSSWTWSTTIAGSYMNPVCKHRCQRTSLILQSIVAQHWFELCIKPRFALANLPPNLALITCSRKSNSFSHQSTMNKTWGLFASLRRRWVSSVARVSAASASRLRGDEVAHSVRGLQVLHLREISSGSTRGLHTSAAEYEMECSTIPSVRSRLLAIPSCWSCPTVMSHQGWAGDLVCIAAWRGARQNFPTLPFFPCLGW